MPRSELPEESEFTQIDIGQFYDAESERSGADEEGIIALSFNEKALYEELLSCVRKRDPKRIEILEARMRDLNLLAADIARFPSLLERHDLTGGTRTPKLLINSLVKHQEKSDSTLRLPSKASLGKGYIVAKIHTFSSMVALSRRVDAPEKLTTALELEMITMVFTLMVEDVYLNLINDKEQPMEFRQQWALALLLLWEHRNDQTIESVAPVLQSIWLARRKLAPAFGTMMGTSELLLMSIQMDKLWIQFIKQRMGDAGVSQAMEEFLFGISYEQVQQLRRVLKEKGIPAIGRDEVSEFLGEHVKTDAGLDYRDFYSMYTVRRDNARARERMKLDGPHKTLEDYFIQFVTEQDKEKQRNDIFAEA